MNCDQKVYCGVDVSKHYLDAFIDGRTVRFDNTALGARALAKRAGNVHYVFESTGGYERMAAWQLLAAGCVASIVNPGRVREYAKSMGQLAKTDHIDARVITEYAGAASPRPAELPSDEQRRLVVLVERRQQLIDMQTAESNRLDTAGEDELRKMIQQHLRWLGKQIDKLDEDIAQTIRDHGEMGEKAARIESIKGLGKVCAATLLAYLPEIGTLSRQEIAALAGLAPYNRDSGTFRGRRHVCGGRKRLRACLYMAAVCAIQHNPQMKAFYTRLVVDNHRPKKVALTAVMRKLLIAANSAVKNPDFGVVV